MILDSGNRTEFASGAVRDIQNGKGRCDLLPLEVVADYYYAIDNVSFANLINDLAKFMRTRSVNAGIDVIRTFCEAAWSDEAETMFIDISKHFEEGAAKYGDNNWRKGIPCNRYMDSAIRHLLKWHRGDTDENHDRAFMWNMMCCLWTYRTYGWDLENFGEEE